MFENENHHLVINGTNDIIATFAFEEDAVMFMSDHPGYNYRLMKCFTQDELQRKFEIQKD